MIRRALISLSDKTGLIPFAKALSERGAEILSTGGTARALLEAGISVTPVEAYTGSPEVMDGRVKTLHPRVHGGILMRGEIDMADLERLGGAPIDLVAVNLYPFEQTIGKPGVAYEEAIENIDIGGPAMLRSAAKNHARVTVICEPSDYASVLEELSASGEVSLETRKRLASKVFAHTAAYDGAIAAYLSSFGEGGQRSEFPAYLAMNFTRAYELRYGENPHQKGAFYRDRKAALGSLAGAESLGAGGKELSFNNLVDADAALAAVIEFDEPAAVIVKHANPCGVAAAGDVETAYRMAQRADALSAFGGIVALNRAVNAGTARALIETFLECVAAPAFDADALEILRTKANLRILAMGDLSRADAQGWTYKRVGGGIALQGSDISAAGEVENAKVVTRRAPSEEEMAALKFAWRVCKHVKSNAIVLARAEAGACVTAGVGAGQMSRVESVRIACGKAGESAAQSVLASDAFFPFPDGLELAAQHGVRAAVQPGGSVKDAAVIAAADAAGMAMIFTGVRHFRH